MLKKAAAIAATALVICYGAPTTQAQAQSVPTLYDLLRFEGQRRGSAFRGYVELHFSDTNTESGTVSGCFFTLGQTVFPLSGTWSWYRAPRMLVSLSLPDFITDTVEIEGILLPAPDDAPNFSFRGHWLNGFLGSGAFDAVSIIPALRLNPNRFGAPSRQLSGPALLIYRLAVVFHVCAFEEQRADSISPTLKRDYPCRDVSQSAMEAAGRRSGGGTRSPCEPGLARCRRLLPKRRPGVQHGLCENLRKAGPRN